MAEFMQLDKAAAAVGKSEVTLRRLIKAGKIPFQKEKTLTGFIYLVDPDQVRAYYQVREGAIFAEEAQEVFRKEDGEAVTTPELTHTSPETGQLTSLQGISAIRVPVAGESGGAYEYWQKKSERYEEKYNVEVVKHAQTREELGVWRGRAEQAQSMLVKLLPAPQEVEVKATHQEIVKKEDISTTTMLVIAGLVILLIAAVGAIIYIKYLPR